MSSKLRLQPNPLQPPPPIDFDIVSSIFQQGGLISISHLLPVIATPNVFYFSISPCDWKPQPSSTLPCDHLETTPPAITPFHSVSTALPGQPSLKTSFRTKVARNRNREFPKSSVPAEQLRKQASPTH